MIKILHCADLHLKERHKYSEIISDKGWDKICNIKLDILNHIPNIAKKHNVDMVTFGGDIFDTSNPPEFLKAEFCKILNKIPKNITVNIIPGREGDHDYISSNNFVLMDLLQAYLKTNINISDLPFMKVCDGVLLTHLMMEGINELYKHTIPFCDKRFRSYKTIILGDYHGWYVRRYAGKTFLYPGAPYPVRYGENGRYLAILTVDNTGEVKRIQKIKLPTFHFLENVKDIDSVNEPFVLKIKKIVTSDKINKIISDLQEFKRDLIKSNEKCLDVIWEIKSKDVLNIKKDLNNKSVRDTCLDYIQYKSTFPKTTTKIFNRMEAEV